VVPSVAIAERGGSKVVFVVDDDDVVHYVRVKRLMMSPSAATGGPAKTAFVGGRALRSG
jgi:hypothetical protein